MGTRCSPGMGTRWGRRGQAGVSAGSRLPGASRQQRAGRCCARCRSAAAPEMGLVANLLRRRGARRTAMAWRSQPGLSPCAPCPRLLAQGCLGTGTPAAHSTLALAAFPASCPWCRWHFQRLPMWHPALTADSIPTCPITGAGLGSAGTQRPPRRGGARHLGLLSGGSCEMSANILCGLLQQASRCRCWRASRNRNPAVTNGSGTATAMPTRAGAWAVSWHPPSFRDAPSEETPEEAVWVDSGARGCRDGLTPRTCCQCYDMSWWPYSGLFFPGGGWHLVLAHPLRGKS